MPKNVILLGSTGSLGIQTLEILAKYPRHFKIIGLSSNNQEEILKQQAEKLRIKHAILAAKDGHKKLLQLIKLKKADIIINVISGIAGINPSIEALKSKKILILGNKESLVAEGKTIMRMAKLGKNLIPLDSEHNAIFEILQKTASSQIRQIILPCSGGPFYHKSKAELKKATLAQALHHPKWRMGRKISIESSTLINKGLEIIEAHYLFNLPFSKIQVKFHPECIIHGIVKFTSGKNLTYYASPDMREHIENALLRAAGLKIPKRNIQPLKSSNKFTLKPITNKYLTGINLVLKGFKKNPKQFLKKEEKIIQKFLNNQINFLEIFKLLRT